MKGKKQTKKGIAYKAGTLAKQILPAHIKQPPRQPRPLKALESFPQIDKKNSFDFPQLWPGNQAARAFQFNLESDVPFKDPMQKQIQQHFPASTRHFAWLRIQHGYRLAEHSNKFSLRTRKLGRKNSQNLSFQFNLQQPQQIPPKSLNIVSFLVRDQTPAQYQKRKKQQAQRAQKLAKQKKKAPKKQDAKEDGPIKVKQPQLTNLMQYQHFSKQILWISSQLQFIKDRDLIDIYTGQSVIKKIYPQVDQIPVLNKSGKYWVKLYFMGKQVKIQVDDRVPFAYDKVQLPISQSGLQIWPTILSKAIIKLMLLNKQPLEIIGSPMVLYSLTGLVAQKINFNNFSNWNFLSECLSNPKYLSKQTHVLLYSNSNKELCPSNQMQKPSDFYKLFDSSNSQFRTNLQNGRSKSAVHSDPNAFLKISSGVRGGVCYPVVQMFCNNTFNMVSVKKKSAKESRLRAQFNQLTKISQTIKSIQQKKQHRRRKKQLKQKLAIQEQKRNDLMLKPAKPYRIFKLLNDSIRINCQFSAKEILIAKRCIVNQLTKPPNYDNPDTNHKSVQSYSIAGSKKDKDLQQNQNKQLDDFSSVINYQQPLGRVQGIWILQRDLVQTFDNMLIFFNQNCYANKISTQVESNLQTELNYDPSKQLIIMNKGQEQQAKILFSFAPKFSKGEAISPEPFCILQKFDFNRFESLQNFKTLRGVISSQLVSLKNINQVLRITAMTPLPYTIWVSSNNNFKLSSISSYLTEYQKFTSKSLNIEFPDCQSQKYQQLARFKFSNPQTDSNVVIRLKLQEPVLTKYVRYRVLQNMLNPMNQHHEGVIENRAEKTFLILPYINLGIERGKQYSLLVQACFPFNVQGGSGQLQALLKHSSTSFQIQQIVQPVKYIQKIQPSKYNLLFSQRLLVSKEVSAVISAEIFNSDSVPAPTQADPKKNTKKQVSQIIQQALEKSYLISMQLLEQGKPIIFDQGFNRCALYSIYLKPGKNYIVSAKFIDSQPDISKLYFSLKVYSTDTIVIVRDTVKQQAQKSIRMSWQQKQPGRANNAKDARKRYFLLQKLSKGDTLTQEEIQFCERKKKKQQQPGKKGAKDAKKGAKAGKKEQVEEKKKVEQRPAPKSSQNYSSQLHSFLKHMQCARIIHQNLTQQQHARIRSQQNLNEIKQSAKLSEEQYAATMYRNMRINQSLKLLQKDQKSQLLDFLLKTKQSYKQKIVQYITNRNSLFDSLRLQNQKFKTVIDLLKSQKINQEQLNKAISSYEVSFQSNDFSYVAKKAVDNIKFQVLLDRLNAALSNYQIQQLNKCLNQIKQLNAQIEEQILLKAQQMVEQAEANPNFMAEKQAELKKNKKGKK